MRTSYETTEMLMIPPLYVGYVKENSSNYLLRLTSNGENLCHHSVSSSSLGKTTKDATLSFSRSFMTRTPCVARLNVGISSRPVRIAVPFCDIATSSPALADSSSPPTTAAPTSCLVFAVMDIVFIPEPPRPCVLYSESLVFFPYPV